MRKNNEITMKDFLDMSYEEVRELPMDNCTLIMIEMMKQLEDVRAELEVCKEEAHEDRMFRYDRMIEKQKKMLANKPF